MKKVFSLALLAAVGVASAQTTLAAGDLAIVGYNASNPDQLAVLTTRDLAANTTFYFADYGWSTTTNTFRFGGEGYVKVTLKRAFTAGEVLFFDSTASFAFPQTPDFTFLRESGGVEYGPSTTTPVAQYAPSSAGDQTVLFQATSISDTTTPAPSVTGLNLIYGLNADGTSVNASGWQANAVDANTSALPPSLTAGVTAIGLVQSGSAIPGATTEFDNYQYIGPRTGTSTELLAAIGDRANWEGRDTTVYAFDTTSFTVVPEPASMAVLGIGLAALRRRRRNAR